MQRLGGGVVTSAIIKRLAEQVGALETRFKSKGGMRVVFITCALGEASDTAWARHQVKHPEDAEADVVISTFYDEKPGSYERAKEIAAGKTESLRTVGQVRSIGLVPHKAISTEQWVSQWGKHND